MPGQERLQELQREAADKIGVAAKALANETDGLTAQVLRDQISLNADKAVDAIKILARERE